MKNKKFSYDGKSRPTNDYIVKIMTEYLIQH
jgi:hypothetical protein